MMHENIYKILNSIPSWSKKLQGKRGLKFKKELESAHNFVGDYSGNYWTYGKSVGNDGNYHENGAGARKRLEFLGFKDILSSAFSENEIKEKMLVKFQSWAEQVEVKDLNEKLNRFLSGNLRVKFRLLIPPELNYADRTPLSKAPENRTEIR